ncbi:hypothetical protein FOA52_006346 [Chlamydomonas sp. UWO 241]|nr:hypothetical protein FOA52_006346 [Chlamydomonas sp. UWO 241]
MGLNSAPLKPSSGRPLRAAKPSAKLLAAAEAASAKSAAAAAAAAAATATATAPAAWATAISAHHFLSATNVSQYLLDQHDACKGEAAKQVRQRDVAALIEPVTGVCFKCVEHDGAGCIGDSTVTDDYSVASCTVTSEARGVAGSSIKVDGHTPYAAQLAGKTWLFPSKGPLPIVDMEVVGTELVVYVRALDIPGVRQAYPKTVALGIGSRKRSRMAGEDRRYDGSGRSLRWTVIKEDGSRFSTAASADEPVPVPSERLNR